MGTQLVNKLHSVYDPRNKESEDFKMEPKNLNSDGKQNFPWFPPNDNYPPIFPTFPTSQRLDATHLPRYNEPVNIIMRPKMYAANTMPDINRIVNPVVGGYPTCGAYPRATITENFIKFQKKLI